MWAAETVTVGDRLPAIPRASCLGLDCPPRLLVAASPSLIGLSRNNHERAVEMVREVVARAAQETFLEATQASTADDDEIGVLGFCGLENHFRGPAFEHLDSV